MLFTYLCLKYSHILPVGLCLCIRPASLLPHFRYVIRTSVVYETVTRIVLYRSRSRREQVNQHGRRRYYVSVF